MVLYVMLRANLGQSLKSMVQNYPFIAIYFYCNIVCENVSCDMVLQGLDKESRMNFFATVLKQLFVCSNFRLSKTLSCQFHSVKLYQTETVTSCLFHQHFTCVFLYNIVFYSFNVLTGVNFINVIHARFSYEHCFLQLHVRRKSCQNNIRTKKLYVKC